MPPVASETTPRRLSSRLSWWWWLMFRRSKEKDIVRHSVHDVFTPTRPASLNYVERRLLDSLITNALSTPGKQLIVYGESGSGKSTLLRNKLAELDYEYITTQCSAAMSYEQLLLDAFDQLNPYYIQDRETKRERSISPGVEADFKAIKLRLDTEVSHEVGEVRTRILPPQLTPQRLATFLGELGMSWIVEDFHKIREDQKTLYAQCLKIFSDLSAKYPKTRTITVGATETARQVVHYDPEMRRRVSELLVPLMNRDELGRILSNGQELLNVSLILMADEIIDYSAGMASICHQIALNVCVVRGIDSTQSKRVQVGAHVLEPAMRRYVSELSDTTKYAFHRAGAPDPRRKLGNSRPILAALASGPVSGMSLDEISAIITAKLPKYPKESLRGYLDELTQEYCGSIVRLGIDGRYRFSEPIYHTYAKATMAEAPTPKSTASSQHERVIPVPARRDVGVQRSYLNALPGGSVWFSSTPIEIITAKSIFDNFAIVPRPVASVTDETLNALLWKLDNPGIPSTPNAPIAAVPKIGAPVTEPEFTVTTHENNVEQEDHD
jgi:energy-coupling factor transporter ATP-binding protein EcfA2